jgi:hypothetical protein
MYRPKRLVSWALVLLAGGFCWAENSALAQSSTPVPIANQNAQRPIKMVTNPNQKLRQSAQDQLAAAVDIRTQNDRQYKKYIDSVAKHNNDVDAFVKAKKGGLR